jgi:hypothetical protein
LLCRQFVKGRDWYDLLWYISKGTKPNLVLLENALLQTGPFKNSLEKGKLSKEWLLEKMLEKIEAISLEAVKKDVLPFVNSAEINSVNSWSKELFVAGLKRVF